MKASGTATSCARRKTPSQGGLGSRREGACLFVPHMDPIDRASIDRMGNPVHRVADNPVTGLHAGRLQRFDQQIGDAFAHDGSSHFAYVRVPEEFGLWMSETCG